ncbi:MAG: hypothetical protein HYZ28_01885 [Myxococcales bacterium]|nr:hypothetical protein [Myxococcales bacterium]
MSGNVKQGPPKPPQAPAANPPKREVRPRQQVAYEGDDEFSVMSLDPERREKAKKPKVNLTAEEGEKSDPGAGGPKSSAWHFVRKIFGH